MCVATWSAGGGVVGGRSLERHVVWLAVLLLDWWKFKPDARSLAEASCLMGCGCVNEVDKQGDVRLHSCWRRQRNGLELGPVVC